MRVTSSTIGMESARKSTSVTGRASKLLITSGKQSIKDGTGSLLGNLFNTDGKEDGKQAGEKENPENALKATFEEMRSKSKAITSGNIRMEEMSQAQKQLMDIRQQCINYLMDLLFPGRRGNNIWNFNNFSYGMNGGTTYTSSIEYYHEETEETQFSTQGTVKCADGREINFNLNVEMSRSFQEYYESSVTYTQSPMHDPLVINLDGNIADLSDQTFFFDLDGDGQKDEINRLAAGSGFLALDKNGDGIINDGSELFGTKSGNGFADLAAYDTDHNGFIDEGDAIWDKLKIWVMDENGNEQLYSLAEKGVGAICLQNMSTDFKIADENNQTKGMIRNTGVFLYENGNVGTIQHVDMALHGQSQEKIKESQSKYVKWLYDMAL